MKITKNQLKQIIKEELSRALTEQGSFIHSDDLPGGSGQRAPTTGQLMGRGDEPVSKNIKVEYDRWKPLAKMLMEPPYNEDPEQLEKDLADCLRVAQRGEKGAGIQCLWRKNVGRRSAMEEVGLIPKQKGS
jgi:hypothetical protein